MFQENFKGALRKISGCFKEVSSCKKVSRVFQGRLKGVSRQFQRRFKEVSRVFKESVKCVLKNFKEKVSRVFSVDFKGI